MKEATCSLSTVPSMGEWSHSCFDVGNSQYLFFFLKISFEFARELSSLFFVGFIVVVEEIYTSVARDFGDI